MEFVMKVLKFIYENDMYDDIYWKFNDDKIEFVINASDIFFWGCADSEPLTEETFEVFKKAVEDCDNIEKYCGYGGMLYASRIRGMRPQGAAYPEEPEFKPLFDACGPPRDTGLGNPKGSL